MKILLLKKLIIALTALLAFYQSHPALIPQKPLKFGVAQAQTDYKFWYIKRDDDGFITEVAVRFYEGAVTTQNELKTQPDGSMALTPITRYRRTKILGELDLPKTKKFKNDAKGNPAVVYTQSDFGVIKTDDELRLFLNQELAKDKIRTPIPEQTGTTLK